MIVIKAQSGEIIVLNSSARLRAGVNGDGEHAVIAEVPVGSSCDAANDCVIDREFWTLAEVADHEAAQRVLACLWQYVEPCGYINMDVVLQEVDNGSETSNC